jgi:trimeric autotransporter adhesin
MNKSYISIWNDVSGTWVAAPETARTGGGAGTISSRETMSGNDMTSRPATPLKAAFVPIAMALGAVMLPGSAAAQVRPGAGGLELCAAPIGSSTVLGSAYGSAGYAIGAVYCAPDSNGNLSFSLNNSSNPVGAEGYDSGSISARVAGYSDGRILIQGSGGISMIGQVNMNGYKIGNLQAGSVTSGSGDAVNGGQLYEYTRYFKANSSSADPSSDAAATGANSVATGAFAKATGANSVAFGANARALVTNSVALGANSVASRSDSVSVGYLSADGKSQYTRQITNVTAGAAGTDAVNVDQLNAAIASVNGTGNGIIADNPVGYDSPAADMITLKGTNGTRITNVKTGDASSEWSTDAVNGGQLYETNQKVAGVADNVASVSDDLDGVKSTVNDLVKNGLAGSPLVVGYDSTDRDKVTLGGVEGTKPVSLTNVAKGDVSFASSDAVTGAQLFQTNEDLAALSDSVNYAVGSFLMRGANYFSANSNELDSSAEGNETVAIGGGSVATADNSVALGSGSLADRENAVSVGARGAERQIINVAAGDISSANSTDAVTGGQLYETNANLANLTDNVNYAVGAFLERGANYFAANSNQPDSSAAGDDSVSIGGGSVASANNSVALGSNSLADREDAVSVGAAGAERQITNVAGATQDTDAVNLAQLKRAISNASIGSGPGAVNAVAYDSDAHDSLTLGDLDASAPVALKNVAAGKVGAGSTDAVNGGQLYNTADSMAKALGGGSTVNPDGTVSAPGYTVSGTTYDNMGDALSAINGAAGDLVGAAKYVKVVSTLNAALASGDESVAVGGGARATNTRTLAIGTGATAAFENSTAIGVNATTDAANTVSFGSRGAEMRLTHIADGIDPNDAVTMAQLDALQVQLAGVQPSSGVKSMLAGAAAPVTSYMAVSSQVTGGSNTSASDDLNAMAIGPVATAIGENALSVGARSAASSNNSTAVGAGAGALSLNSTAIGASATVQALSDNSVSIGYNTRASAFNTLALGANAGAASAGSVAIGYGAFAGQAGTNGLALGSNTSVSAVNGVAIGYAALADRANAVSVGNKSRQSQIINMAAGTAGTDAVNVNQLSSLADAIGGGAGVNPDGTIRKPSFTVGSQTFSDVGAAIAASVAEGSASAVQYDNPEHTRLTLGGTDASEPVTLANVADGVADNDAVNVGQLKQMGMGVDADGNVTNSFVAYDDTSLGAITLKGADGTKISNLKAGDLTATSQDAVTGGQLFETNANVANVAADLADAKGEVANVTNTINNIVTDGAGIKYFHANSTLDDSTATGANAVAIGAAANASADDAVALGSNSVADRANTVSVGALGAERQIVNVASGTKATDAVNLSQLQALGANVDENGAVTNSFVAYDNPEKSALTLGGLGANTPVLLTNLDKGKVAESSSDAVTGGQLYNTANSIADALGGGAAVADGTLSKPSYVVSGTTYGSVGSALDAVDSQIGQIGSALGTVDDQINQINTNFSTNLKYVKVVSESGSALASGVESVAIGGNAMASGDHALAIGAGANATFLNSVAIGVNSIADGDNTVSVGSRGAEKRITHVADGIDPNDVVTMSQLDALQAQLSGAAPTSGVKSMMQSASAVTGFIAVSSKVTGGSNTTASDDLNAMAIGPVASAIGENALAIGGRAGAGSNNSTAVGAGAGALSVNSTAIGASASVQALSDNSVSIGYNTRAAALNTLALGAYSGTSAAGGVSIGYNAFVGQSASNGLALGSNTSVSAANGVAIGYAAVADRANAVSVGNKSRQSQIINVAVGTENTDAVNLGQVRDMLGSLSGSGSLDGVSYDTAAHDVLTLGGTTNPTPAVKLRNVAAGAVGSTSTDAVNGSQLYNTASSVAAALGGDATVGADGKVSKPTYTVGGKTYSDIGSALVAAADGNGGAASPEAVNYDTPAHDKLTLGTASKPVTLSNVAAGVAGNDAVNVDQLKAMGATVDGSGKVSNAFVAYDDTTKGKVTLGGIGASVPVTLTNVAAGQVSGSSKDAINGSQLYNTASSVAAALGGDATVGADGKVSKPTYTVGGKTFSDIGAALVAAADGNGSGGGSSPEAVNYDTPAHDKLTLGTASKPVTLSNVADGVASNDAVNVQQLKAMGANIGSDGKVSNAFVAYDDASKGQVTFGGAGASMPVILTNVAQGQITSGSRDAINGSQLYNAMASAADAMGGNSKVTADGKLTAPAYTLDGQTFTGVNSALDALNAKIGTDGDVNGVVYDTSEHDKLTLGGSNATKPVTLANVADATADDEAVNLKQLKAAGLSFDSDGNATNPLVSYDDAGRRTLTFGNGVDPTQLKNVAAGSALTDAVNVGQMQNYVSDYVDQHGGGSGSGNGNGNGNGGTANGVAYDDASKSSVTLGGGDATGPVKLSNLADGDTASDAVTYGQFSSLQNRVNNIANGDLGESGAYVNIGTPSGTDGGVAAVASGADSIALGNGAKATGVESIAIGKNAVTAGDNAVAMGSGASAQGANSVALGNGATAPNVNSVALGAGSTTDRDNSVSVGTADLQRQLTNVANGTQATDAVNLGQLQQSMGNMNAQINNVDRSAAKGIASASALNVVTPYLPGRTTLNAGIANYRGFQAVGLGVSRWNEKGTINYNLGVSSSGGNSTIVRAGIGIVLGN